MLYNKRASIEERMSRIKQIIEQYFHGTHNDNLQKEFLHWFTFPKLEKEKEDILSNLWNSLDISPSLSTDNSYQEIKRKILALSVQTPSKRRIRFPLFSKIAVVAIIIILSTVIYFYSKESQTEDEMLFVEYFVPRGELLSVVLPDSSTVELNSGSYLRYPKKFSEEIREVYLEGEGYFSVVSNKDAPFVVEIEDLKVRVLGTEFNISAYKGDDEYVVTLRQGKVNVLCNGESVILKPNEQLIYHNLTKTMEKKKVVAEDYLLYRDGNLMFKGASVQDVVRKLENKYNVAIRFNPDKYKEEKVTVKFNQGRTLEECLIVLKSLIPGLKYEIGDSIVYLE